MTTATEAARDAAAAAAQDAAAAAEAARQGENIMPNTITSRVVADAWGEAALAWLRVFIAAEHDYAINGSDKDFAEGAWLRAMAAIEAMAAAWDELGVWRFAHRWYSDGVPVMCQSAAAALRNAKTDFIAAQAATSPRGLVVEDLTIRPVGGPNPAEEADK